MSNLEELFQDEMNKKFTKIGGRVRAEFGSGMTFIPTERRSNIQEFKKRYPTEYRILFNSWVDNVHPY